MKTLRIYTLAFPVWSMYFFLLLKFSLIAYLIRRNGIPTSLWKSILAKIVLCSTTLYFVYLFGVENCIHSFHLYHGNWVCIYSSIIWFLLISFFFLHNQLTDFYSLLASGCRVLDMHLDARPIIFLLMVLFLYVWKLVRFLILAWAFLYLGFTLSVSWKSVKP